MAWAHIDVDWRFATSSALATEITCKLRPFCLLIGYTKSYQFFSASVFAFSTALTTAPSASTIVCSGAYARANEA